MPLLDPFGLRRVVAPVGVLPQAADVLDPSLPLADDEIAIEVDHLNIDAASFRQLESTEHTPERIAARIAEIVRARGKMQNPVTGSGGMLVGRISEIGPAHPQGRELHPGDTIATLVSLTLTPLVIRQIRAVHAKSERVDVEGRAILFASGVLAKLPPDLPQTLSLAVLDVCGAPAWTTRLVEQGMTVLVIGAGKSGSLVCAAAREKMDGRGRILVADLRPEGPQNLVRCGLADAALAADATRPVEFLRLVESATEGRLADLVVNCASVPGTEMASILATKPQGQVLFFSMATSFPAAALGAEGVARDVKLLIGNGYAAGHAALALDLVRRNAALRAMFEERVGR
jgi:L-erythro-3,5-diaminohexanoate dehydrogenase